jgi:hypothetical protein
VKRRRSEAKPPISPPSVLDVSSESKEEDGWVKESEGEADAESLYCAGLFFEDHDGEIWVRCQKLLKWAHTIRVNYPKRALLWQV